MGSRGFNAGDRALIETADAVILPQALPYELYRACEQSPARVFPDYRMRFLHPEKIEQIRMFRKFDLPHPASQIWASVDEFNKASAAALPPGFPFFIKEKSGHEGAGIHFVTDSNALDECLSRISCAEKRGEKGFIVQEAVPAGGNVLRAVIIGSRLITYWKRPKGPGGRITTVALNATIDREWRMDLQEKGKMVAARLSALTGINLAAVDMVFPLNLPDPDPLLLEVNYYYGRRGLGGSLKYYHLLHEAIRDWLKGNGFDPNTVRLV